MTSAQKTFTITNLSYPPALYKRITSKNPKKMHEKYFFRENIVVVSLDNIIIYSQNGEIEKPF